MKFTYLIINEIYRFFFFLSVVVYKKYQSLTSYLQPEVKCNLEHTGCVESVLGIHVLGTG